MPRMIAVVVVVLLSAFRCESVSTMGGICTEIGCDSGLLVDLQAPPAEPYSIEAYVAGAAARYVRVCDDACGGMAFFKDFTPDHVTIEVISALGTQRHEVRPVYERLQPNGPGCDPVCRTATVRLPADALDAAPAGRAP